MEQSERRRYFRVDVEMIFSYKLISQEVKAKQSKLINLGGGDHPDNHKLFITLESDLQEIIKKFHKTQPELATALNLLNRKINLLSQGGPMPDTQQTILDKTPQLVNISACGVGFKEAHPIAIGEAVELELVLLPEQAYIIAYGQVVACEKKPLGTSDNSSKLPYRISVDFDAIRDEDVERIIQHIMREEAKLLKARRHLHS